MLLKLVCFVVCLILLVLCLMLIRLVAGLLFVEACLVWVLQLVGGLFFDFSFVLIIVCFAVIGCFVFALVCLTCFADC